MSAKPSHARLARIDRELAERSSLQRALASQAWATVGQTVAEALTPYPDAHQAVAAALETLRGGCAHADEVPVGAPRTCRLCRG